MSRKPTPKPTKVASWVRELPEITAGTVTDAKGEEKEDEAVLYIDEDAGEIRIQHPEAQRIAALLQTAMFLLDQAMRSTAAVKQLS